MRSKKENLLYFHPVSKEYIWGSESWLLSDQSVIANGEHQGSTLKDLFPFPLLLKLIDAKENLSIQVHPKEKNEVWYFLKPGSAIAGLKKSMDRFSLEEGIKAKKLDSLLQTYTLKEGDSLYIPAGTVHSLLAGSYLLEVQENCNTTYRLYDWERERDLHIEDALRVMDYQPKKEGILVPQLKEDGWEQILKTAHFTIERITTTLPWKSPREMHEIFFLLQGKASISVNGSKEGLESRRACLCLGGSILPEGLCQFLRIYN